MKFRIFRGGAAIGLCILSLSAFASILAFENSGQVDIALGITGEKNTKQSAYSSVEEMRVAEKANEVQTQEEGSVLFFNEDNALPLSSAKKVTLLGRTSADNIFKGGSGGSTTTDDAAISLYEALTSQGISINEKVYGALKDSSFKRARGDIGEVPASFYTDDMKSSFKDYGDAAIIVLGRYSGEQQDLCAGGDSGQDNAVDANGDPVDVSGIRMLALHDEERDTIKMAVESKAFSKVIVLLNTVNPMEIGELKGLGVDACLWVGLPGYAGFEGVANVLLGKADPSGRLADTYATNSLSAPAMRNYGSFNWDNITTASQNKYLIYAEDIYLGYKYYETRYQDQVLNINNAASSKGCYASSSSWDYAAEMDYTFGYGTSYASFTQKLDSLKWDKTTHTVTAKVTVKNEGSSSYSGKSKDVVELYVSLPYEKGQAAKSAIQLIGYGKTKELAKGEEDTLTITVDDYLFATYDQNATNGADTSKKGCYTFDAGDYSFAVGDDAHDALNNVLAKKGTTGLFDADGKPVSGDSSKVVIDTLDKLDNTTHAKSHENKDVVVSNQFDDIDINHFEDGAVTYLTRDDWSTYPVRYTGLSATDEMKTIIDGHTYSKPADAPEISSFKYSQKYEETMMLAELVDEPYDSDKWDTYIDQLTPSQLAAIAGEKFGNTGLTDYGCPDNSAADGPDGIQANTGFSHVCENLAASTYNDELLKKRGEFMAEDGMWSGQNGVYGFGANMHRTVYAGRNFEYYSEDTTLSYLAGAVQTKAAQDKGLTTYVKHFCANDQEVWRNGCSTLMREQAYRQGPLKGFEGSFTKGESLGTMTSNSRVGLRVVPMDYATMTAVLRDEWGFKGTSMTDSSKGTYSYLYTKEAVAAGIDQFNNDETRGTSDMKNYLIKEKDGFLWKRAREIAHHYFYTISRNFCMSGLSKNTTVETKTSWWKTALIALISVEAVITAGLAGTAAIGGILSYSKKRKEGKE